MANPQKTYSVTELFRLWAGGASYTEIAASLGVKESYVYTLRCRHKLPKRKRTVPESRQADPTTEEIKERAAECRQRHFAKRRGESEDDTRKRVWMEDKKWLRTSSQSQA